MFDKTCHKITTVAPPVLQLLSTLFPKTSLGPLLAPVWLTLAAFLPPVGSLLIVLASIPAPFWEPFRLVFYVLLTADLLMIFR